MESAPVIGLTLEEILPASALLDIKFPICYFYPEITYPMGMDAYDE